MKFEKRTNSDGSSYYRFTYYDTRLKKPVHLKRAEIKKRFGHDILTADEAKECVKLLSAQYETEKIRIERRLVWEKEFYNFVGLCEQYEKHQKKSAPNSWKNNVFYLKNYVLPWFLTKQKLNNIELWEDYFEQYRDFLEKDAYQLRNTKKLISYSSKNHSVKALNTFLGMLYNKKLLHRAAKCEAFPEHLINKRDIDDVVYPEEMQTIYSKLKELGYPKEAVFFRYLFFSGMRFSEGLAISLGDLFQGELPSTQMLAKKITLHGMKYHGYIVSDSQVNEKLVRFPFKGKKEISEKHARTIPIVDSILWNDLVSLAEEQFKHWDQNAKDKRYCFLFGGLDDTTSTNHLIEAFESAKLKYRSWHCLRHSRATWLIGETGDEVLGRAWLGHSSPRIFERYNHLYQALIREAKGRETVGKEFNLRKV